tara:strand:- start:183 stop:545 length:363 start_codon:yes stop_codon:yes gene_type:complete
MGKTQIQTTLTLTATDWSTGSIPTPRTLTPMVTESQTGKTTTLTATEHPMLMKVALAQLEALLHQTNPKTLQVKIPVTETIAKTETAIATTMAKGLNLLRPLATNSTKTILVTGMGSSAL